MTPTDANGIVFVFVFVFVFVVGFGFGLDRDGKKFTNQIDNHSACM